MEQETTPKKSKSVPRGEPTEKTLQARAASQAVAQQLKCVEANILLNTPHLLLKSSNPAVKSAQSNGVAGGSAGISSNGKGSSGRNSSPLPMSPLIEAIRKQVEFYFGDPNLSRDRFLQGLITKHDKGYVDLKVLMGFKKIQFFFSTSNIQGFEERLTTLRAAIKSSPLLKMCKRQLMVKRAVPFQAEKLKAPEVQKETDEKVIYVENLPSNCTQEALAEIFKAHGTILYISLPKTTVKSEGTPGRQSKCKGYAFIEFVDTACAQSALSVNNSIPERFINGGGREPLQPLSVISKKRWNELKQQFKALSKRPPNTSQMDLEEVNGVPSTSGLKVGTVLRVKGIPADGFTKNDFKVFLLAQTDKFEYVDYQPGKPEAFIRFASPESCTQFKDAIKSSISIRSYVFPVESVSPQEEAEYFKKVEKKRDHFRAQKIAQQAKQALPSPKSSSGRKPTRKAPKKAQEPSK